jgi:hypothetical protein
MVVAAAAAAEPTATTMLCRWRYNTNGLLPKCLISCASWWARLDETCFVLHDDWDHSARFVNARSDPRYSSQLSTVGSTCSIRRPSVVSLKTSLQLQRQCNPLRDVSQAAEAASAATTTTCRWRNVRQLLCSVKEKIRIDLHHFKQLDVAVTAQLFPQTINRAQHLPSCTRLEG